MFLAVFMNRALCSSMLCNQRGDQHIWIKFATTIEINKTQKKSNSCLKKNVVQDYKS